MASKVNEEEMRLRVKQLIEFMSYEPGKPIQKSFTNDYAQNEDGSIKPALTPDMNNTGINNALHRTMLDYHSVEGLSEVVEDCWIEALSHPKQRARDHAAYWLGYRRVAKAVPHLVEKIENEKGLYGRAWSALAKIGVGIEPYKETAVPCILRVLEKELETEFSDSLVRVDERTERVGELLETMGKLGVTEALPVMEKYLNNPSFANSNGVGLKNAFVSMGSESVPVLLRVMKDASDLTASIIIPVLGELGATEAVTALLNVPKQTCYYGCESRSFEALEKIGRAAAPKVLEALEKNVWKKKEESEYDASALIKMVQLLGKYQHADAVPLLIEIHEQQNPSQLRTASAVALGKIADERARETILKRAKGQRFIDDEYQTALERLGGPEVCKFFIGRLHEHVDGEKAEHALVQIGEEARPFLLEALENPPEWLDGNREKGMKRLKNCIYKLEYTQLTVEQAVDELCKGKDSRYNPKNMKDQLVKYSEEAVPLLHKAVFEHRLDLDVCNELIKNIREQNKEVDNGCVTETKKPDGMGRKLVRVS